MWYYSRIMAGLVKLGAAFAVLLLAAAIAGPGAAFAAEDAAKVVRKYPPYPDVWGRLLPFPNDGSYYISAKAYERDDGHILIKTYSGSKLGDQKHIFHVLDFFTGRFKEDKSGIDFLRHPKYRRLLEFDLTLPDGSRIEHKNESFSNCRETWDVHIVKRARDGQITADKMLLALYDRPVRTGIMRHCALSEGADHYIAKWRQLEPAFALLRDGTVLAYDIGSVFSIRLDGDLRSPFLTHNPKLFLVDREEVLTIVKQALRRPGPPLQNVDDAVYDYLMKLKKQRKGKSDAK